MRLLDDHDDEQFSAIAGGSNGDWVSHPWLDTADCFQLEPFPEPLTQAA